MTHQTTPGAISSYAPPIVKHQPRDRSHSVRQAPSYLAISRPAQSKAGQS